VVESERGATNAVVHCGAGGRRENHGAADVKFDRDLPLFSTSNEAARRGVGYHRCSQVAGRGASTGGDC